MKINDDYEIERQLYQQVEKPKRVLMTKIINVFYDYYRINVYVELEEEGLIKRKITQSYMTKFRDEKLTIIPDPDKRPDDLKKKW
jgi:hypothetical protein